MYIGTNLDKHWNYSSGSVTQNSCIKLSSSSSSADISDVLVDVDSDIGLGFLFFHKSHLVVFVQITPEQRCFIPPKVWVFTVTPQHLLYSELWLAHCQAVKVYLMSR